MRVIFYIWNSLKRSLRNSTKCPRFKNENNKNVFRHYDLDACMHACMHAYMHVYMCVRACVRAGVRACGRACVRAGGRACARACVHTYVRKYVGLCMRVFCGGTYNKLTLRTSENSFNAIHRNKLLI